MQQSLFILTSGFDSLDRFLLITYCFFFNEMQIKRWLHLSSLSLGNSPSRRLIQKSNRPEKWPFIATNNWIVLAARWSVKYFFAPNSPLFQKKSGEKKKKKDNYKVFCFSSKHNENSNNNRRVKCHMFKLVCKIPLFTMKKNSTTS